MITIEAEPPDAVPVPVPPGVGIGAAGEAAVRCCDD